MKHYTSILIVSTLILATFFLGRYVDKSHANYIESQQALMQQSTLGAASIIEFYIREARRGVRLFAEEQGAMIGELARNPENDLLQQQFTERVKRHFPGYFAYTITDSVGSVLLDDLEGKVATLCQADIEHFVTGGDQKVFIHPNPLGYHFDIMSRWQDGAGDNGIFFVSFNPEVLARILANSQLHDHRLILLHRDRDGLIEVSAEGTRPELDREIRLSPAELSRIGFMVDVEDTLWMLADMPDAGLFAAHRNMLLREATSIFLAFLVFSGIMAVFITRADRQRSRAEQGLRESRDLLEKRVADRTSQLSDINRQLESEIHERQRAERALKLEIDERRQTEDALRTLHEITSAHDMDYMEKVAALLENGCRQFRMPIGILAHIEGDHYEIIQAVSPDGSILPGDILELGNTYCRETIRADGPIGFEHAANSEWKSHPCYREFNLEAYLGIPVMAGDRVYGTLNFSSPQPRATRFTTTDIEILRLMGQWLGGQISSQQTEQALKQERDRAQRYLDVAGVIMLVINADQTVVLINRKGCEVLGGDEPDIVKRNWFDSFLPDNRREEIRELFLKTMRGEQRLAEYYQNAVVTLHGEQRLIAWHNSLLYDEAGNITGTLSSGEDITVQQQAEEKLRHREELLRLTLENAPIGIVTAGLDGALLSVNPAFCNILGYSAEELTRMTIEDITHPDDREASAMRFQAMARGELDGFELQKRYIRRDDVITVRVRFGLVRDVQDRPLMAVGEVEDITARERTEKLFQLVVESAPNAIVMINSTGRIVLVNSQTERFFGYDRQELLGKPVEVLIPERMRERHPEYVRGFMTEHRARPMGVGRDLYGLRKDGSEFPVEVGLSPIETNQGLLILSAIVDISERVQSDRELQRMRTYLKNIVDSMPSVLIGVDAEGRVTEWNRSAEKATGVPTERAIGHSFIELYPELESQLETIREALRTQTPMRTERLITERDGEEARYAEVMVYPLLEDDATGAVIRVDDVTNRVHIEQMMVQTEKMMSVGGLAAGMAHEINNPLSGVLQNSQNIQRRLTPELEANRRTAEALGVDLDLVYRYLRERGILDFVEAIHQSASRASHIIADMLAFSRGTASDFQPARVDEMIDTVVRLAASDYDLKKKYDFKSVEIVREYDPELETLVCDHTEIEQVLLNLVKNAAQAMAGAGTPAPQRIILRTRREAEYGCIEVEDNGPGMDEQTQRRIFEPFFTTKAVGAGTGLGLSVSYFIVTEQHKGTISVTTNPGEGTCFTVCLPLQGVHAS
jgi:PAS domain S-box-containing protein